MSEISKEFKLEVTLQKMLEAQVILSHDRVYRVTVCIETHGHHDGDKFWNLGLMPTGPEAVAEGCAVDAEFASLRLSPTTSGRGVCFSAPPAADFGPGPEAVAEGRDAR